MQINCMAVYYGTVVVVVTVAPGRSFLMPLSLAAAFG
jgi:hypothetical protein